MKRIGILTYYYKSKNLGGILQAYALPMFLLSKQYTVQQICFDYNFTDKNSRNKSMKISDVFRRMANRKVTDFLL